MSENSSVVRTNCQFCGYLCGILAHIEDGKVVSISPDPNRYPYDATIVRGCRRNRSILEFLDHPSRINYPMKRAGERGSGKWERISWDQALDEIAEKLQSLKDRFGVETLATSIGGPHTVYWPMHRFLNIFGSPNNLGIGQICWNPAIWVNTLTYGWPLEFELVPGVTECAIVWGTNPAESDNSLFWRTIINHKKMGGKLIVIDPRYTKAAANADLWLPVLPATDDALAAGLIKVILDEQLYDQEFVSMWCHGFDRLKEHFSSYSLSEIADITGLSEIQIIQTARIFASISPSTIITGRGIDQIGKSSIQTHRCISILRAITANVDIPGASHIGRRPDFIAEVDFELSEKLSQKQSQKQLGAGRFGLQSYPGYESVSEQTEKFNQQLPKRYLTSAHPDLIWQAMITGSPYPIRAMIVTGSNPLSAHANTHLIHQALSSLDLLVVLELANTPTAMLADYIMPIAGVLESPVFQTNAGVSNIAYGGEAAIPPMYERHLDFYFWHDLGMRLGQEQYWPWHTYRDTLNAMLAPVGLNWEIFCETGLYYHPQTYQNYARLDNETNLFQGFSTPSGKIELYSNLLEKVGYNPLPTYSTNSKECQENQYPLNLITGARKQPFYASGFHQIESIRNIHPHPWVEMSFVTAMKMNMVEGEPVWVETEYGRARFIVHLSEMREGVVSIEYGWWYPELPDEYPFLGGFDISNANCLTSANVEQCEPLLGQWKFNGIPCRVYPVEETYHVIKNATSIVDGMTQKEIIGNRK